MYILLMFMGIFFKMFQGLFPALKGKNCELNCSTGQYAHTREFGIVYCSWKKLQLRLGLSFFIQT